MKINKHVLNRALRVLGKVVCQTSPVELYRSISNADLLHSNGVSAFNRCHCYRVNAPGGSDTRS